jgi:hypothetical protein
MLSGKKSYFVAGLMSLAVFAKIMGWIDEEVYQAILGFLSALGLGALGAGVSKVNV